MGSKLAQNNVWGSDGKTQINSSTIDAIVSLSSILIKKFREQKQLNANKD